MVSKPLYIFFQLNKLLHCYILNFNVKKGGIHMLTPHQKTLYNPTRILTITKNH
ncbi:hypothetical protein F4774DRAFT_382986 [Daldinia eschscholtzii]|nr:hypothetical protein F4774DRAFT_382986 [Daldinia eschscholtzii]